MVESTINFEQDRVESVTQIDAAKTEGQKLQQSINDKDIDQVKISVENLKQKVDEINQKQLLPGGLQIKSFYDRSKLVDSALFTVIKVLIEGVILVIAILFLFLGRYERRKGIEELNLAIDLFFNTPNGTVTRI